jgi:hypothetical protein
LFLCICVKYLTIRVKKSFASSYGQVLKIARGF